MFGERKKVKAIEGEGVQLGLIVTPMLDMAFQIMAFFIAVYNPAPLETHLDGKLLPFAKTAVAGPAADKKDDTPPVDKEPEVKDNVRIIIKAVGKDQEQAGRKDGEPIEIRLKRPGAADEDKIADVNTDFNTGLQRLADELRQIREGPGGAEVSVSIDPDANLKYDYFIRVYDTCKAAKIKEIGFNAPVKAP
jgi:biopolymer transport protein ExbD